MPSDDRGPRPEIAGRARWAAFLVGFVTIWGCLQLAGAGAFTGARGVAGLAVTAAVVVCVERLWFAARRSDMVARLGLGRPAARPVIAALLAGAAVQAVYPLLTAVTGESAELRAGWPFLLVGLFAYHGLAEELAWRAYAFGHLRHGRSFKRAALLTMPLIAATHVPIAVTVGPAVGLGAMLVAAVTAIPFARLYDAGRRTIWAPAILHAAIDSFKLVTLPDEATTTFSLLLVVASLTVPLAVLPFLRRPDAVAGPGRRSLLTAVR